MTIIIGIYSQISNYIFSSKHTIFEVFMFCNFVILEQYSWEITLNYALTVLYCAIHALIFMLLTKLFIFYTKLTYLTAGGNYMDIHQ